MNLTKMKKKKGFTLIELMAVIAIIAILAAVLVPTVTGYINRSKKTAIVTQVRTVINAVEAYNATSSEPITEGTLKDESGKLILTGTTLVEDLADTIGTDLLDSDSIDKLGEMTLVTARAINSDENAIATIKIYPDGEFGEYTATGDYAELGTKGKVNANSTATTPYKKADLK